MHQLQTQAGEICEAIREGMVSHRASDCRHYMYNLCCMWDYYHLTITMLYRGACRRNHSFAVILMIEEHFHGAFLGHQRFYHLGFTWYGFVLNHILFVLTEKLCAMSGNTVGI